MSFRLLFAAAVLTISPATSWAIDIGEIRWGFDGRATPQCFNPLSVLVINPGSRPFEGTLELRDSIGTGGRVGAALIEELYVAPNSSRWVQFYPYVKERFEEWSLHWGRGAGETAKVPQPVLAVQGPVLLVDPDEPTNKRTGLRRFPENLFPPLVTATDGLKTLALDHVPRWEEARRRAFYDWIYRGGRVHLFKGDGGGYPQFSADLAELNAAADQIRIGNGRVFRHDLTGNGISADFIKKTFGSKENAPDSTGGSDDDQTGTETDDENVAGPQPITNSPGGVLFPDITGGLFSYLKSLTRAHHNWVLIYSMAVIYVVTVVPGVHLLGRKRFDYRIVYGALIGSIVMFSLGFAYFGRRGHNEANVVNTVAVARQLPGGALDVTSWSNVFVINGGDYDIVHGGAERLYSTAQAFEAVNGVIHNGAAGQFAVDIPPYSSQPFVSRVKLKADDAEIAAKEFAGGAKLTKLVLTTGKNFPKPEHPEAAYVLYRDKFYVMSFSDGRLRLISQGQSLPEFFGSINWNDFSPYAMRFGNVRGRNPQNEPPLLFDFLMRPLIAWSLNLNRQSEIPTFRLPDDSIRLFVWSELPDSLKMAGSQLKTQKGRMLYVFDILKPGKA
jgi:hypothetical protein